MSECLSICFLEEFPRDSKNGYELATVNESSVFDFITYLFKWITIRQKKKKKKKRERE